jgi:UTP--glucose-1-phosphate uridylyltransferase
METTPEWMLDWYRRSLDLLHNASKQSVIDPTRILAPDSVFYDQLNQSDFKDLRVAVLKLNGGLGTSMGCSGPKSLIEIDQQGTTFMDRIIQRFNNDECASDLIFLNSFNTSNQTTSFIQSNYPDLHWVELFQHSFTKIDESSLLPLDSSETDRFNPPGHGSVYFDLYHSGVLHKLLKKGIDYVFISNADNLAATLDSKIMAYLSEFKPPFLIELTPKTNSDIKGGTVVKCDDHSVLWEIAQVDPQYQTLFQDQPYFNTNNIWVSVPVLLQTIETGLLNLDLIQNRKVMNGQSIIQLEYAMGSAIRSFNKPISMIVPRQRFFPVKKTSDLLLLLSDYAYWNESGYLQWDETKQIDISLDTPFDKVADFFKYFKQIPSIKNASSIHLKGPILFDEKVSLQNHVSLTSSESWPQSISSFLSNSVKTLD